MMKLRMLQMTLRPNVCTLLAEVKADIKILQHSCLYFFRPRSIQSNVARLSGIHVGRDPGIRMGMSNSGGDAFERILDH
jgi:hypothetical protein